MYADVCILFNKLIHLPGQAVRGFHSVTPTLDSLTPWGFPWREFIEVVWGRGGAAYPMEKMTCGVLKTKPRALPSLPGVLEAVGSQPEWTSLRKRSSVLTACPPPFKHAHSYFFLS